MNLLHKKYNLTTQIESKHRFCIDIVFHFLDISYLLRFPAVDTQNSALKNKNEKKTQSPTGWISVKIHPAGNRKQTIFSEWPYIELECEAIEVCCWRQNFCPGLYTETKSANLAKITQPDFAPKLTQDVNPQYVKTNVEV